jgi:hypothetical protein
MFKRDKPASETEADRRIIAESNGWARAVVDARLYREEQTL